MMEELIEVYLNVGYGLIFLIAFVIVRLITISDTFRKLKKLIHKIKNRNKTIPLPNPSINDEDEMSEGEDSLKIPKFPSRKFLNLPDKGSDAFIRVGVNLKSGDDYYIQINSCHSTVRLHGSLREEASIENALHKFQELINVLKEGKAHIINNKNDLINDIKK